jgi:hypothetical protein
MIPLVPVKSQLNLYSYLSLPHSPLTDRVNLASFNTLETRLVVVRIVSWSRERRVDRAVLYQKEIHSSLGSNNLHTSPEG